MSCILANSILSNYEFAVFHGSECDKFKEFMIDLRVTLYRDYPYLYEADRKEEAEYMHWFLNLPKTFVAIAFCKEKPIAFVAGSDFTDFSEHFKGSIEEFEKAGLVPSNYFYIADDLFEPEHPQQEILSTLVHLMEIRVNEQNNYMFCWITEEHDSHPLKPENYKSASALWEKLGYQKSNICIKFSYPTIQPDHSQKKEEHAFTYWLKN
jgi:hypothetical protein